MTDPELQRPLLSSYLPALGISEEVRILIARKREEAMTIAIQKQKAKEEATKKKKDKGRR